MPETSPPGSTPPPTLDGVTHDWVRAGDLLVHVASAGPADAADERHPPLVLLHGWPQHWWCWNRVIGPLATDRRVHAIDLRGHGWTDAPADGYEKHQLAADVLATIDSLGLGEVDVVGHDWGGWVGLLLAQEAPDRVRRAVGVSIPAPWAGMPQPLRRLPDFLYQPVVASPLGPLLHRGLGQAFLRLVFRLATARRRRWSERMLAPYLERWRDPARARAGSRMYRAFLRHELAPVVRGTYSPTPPPMPVLLLPGAADPAIRPGLVRAAEGTAPQVGVETIDGAGHWVPEERPAELVERLRAFLG